MSSSSPPRRAVRTQSCNDVARPLLYMRCCRNSLSAEMEKSISHGRTSRSLPSAQIGKSASIIRHSLPHTSTSVVDSTAHTRSTSTSSPSLGIKSTSHDYFSYTPSSSRVVDDTSHNRWSRTQSASEVVEDRSTRRPSHSLPVSQVVRPVGHTRNKSSSSVIVRPAPYEYFSRTPSSISVVKSAAPQRFIQTPSSASIAQSEGVRLDPRSELLASLERINMFNPPVQTCSTNYSFAGFYSGPTSVAYMFYRLAQIYPDMQFKQQSLLDWAEAYLDVGAQMQYPKVSRFNCGVSCETLAQISLRSLVTGDGSLARQVASFEAVINKDGDDGSNEWLHGRAGYLYILRMCLMKFEWEDRGVDDVTVRALQNASRKTADKVLSSLLSWKCDAIQFLGAAHGIIGIICQVVLTSPESAHKVVDLLKNVLDQQLMSGNFPDSLPACSDELVQFCHGSPGIVVSLQSIQQYFPNLKSIPEVMARARANVWARGLLLKTPCLCHGIAGNALALDSQKEFEYFLAHMTSDDLEAQKPMHIAGSDPNFAGLFTGEAGRAWTWAVADASLVRTCIGYNDV